MTMRDGSPVSKPSPGALRLPRRPGRWPGARPAFCTARRSPERPCTSGWSMADPAPPPHFAFTPAATDGSARAGRIDTVHGPIHTPAFMPVGTAATVKGMTADAVRATGAEIVLANTYHLMLRPGAERVAALGGLHRMMDWPGPILTDSGGFQIMSLAGLRKLDRDGVTFRSHIDGTAHRLTPARSIEIQHMLDATITMVLDECTRFPATEGQTRASMELSLDWAARSRHSCRVPATRCSALSRAESIRGCAPPPPPG